MSGQPGAVEMGGATYPCYNLQMALQAQTTAEAEVFGLAGSTEVQPTNNHKPITNNQEKKTLGKRLASDFSFPKEWEEFCQTERPELSPIKTFDQFKDYWIAQAGQKGVKLDWFATWRNWVRSTNAPKQNPADIVGSNPALATYHPKVEQCWHRALIKGWNGVNFKLS